MHLRGLKLSSRPEHKLSVRAVDAAGNRGPEATASISLSKRVPEHLPPLNVKQSTARPAPAAALPRVAGTDVAILDELDKVDPIDRRADPPRARRLSGRQPSLERRGSSDQAPGSSERIRRVPGPAAWRDSRRRDQTRAGVRRAGRPACSRSRWDAINPVPSRRGPMPDPIVPLAFTAANTAPAKYQSLHVELYFPTAWRPASIPAR